MVFLIALLLLFVGVFSFLRGNHILSLVVFVFFLTGGYQIFSEEHLSGFPISKFADFGLLYVLILSSILFTKRENFFAIDDPVAKAIFLLLVYMIIELLITVLTGQESFGNSFKVFRQYIFFGIYFILRQLKPNEIFSVLKVLFRLTAVLSVLYILQMVLKTQILTGTIESAGSNFESSVLRYRNVPVFLEFFLVWLFFSDKIGRFKMPLIALFLLSFLLPMNRGPIIAFVVVSMLYMALSGRLSSMLKYSIVFFSVGLILWPFLSSRFVKEDTGGDLQKAFVIKDYQNYDSSDGGTFEFRIALLLERVDFLIKNPRYLITGVGMNHEDSPMTQQKFKFFIGAVKLDEGGQYVMQQIDTTDMVWATLILRYGALGLIIFLVVFYSMAKIFLRNIDYSAARVGLIVLGMYLINSFAADTLIRPTSFFMLFSCYLLAFHNSTARLNENKNYISV